MRTPKVKSTGNIQHKQKVSNMKPIINEKKRDTNNLLDKLKNFDSLEALENELQKNKKEFKKLFPDEIKANTIKSHQTTSKSQTSKNKHHSSMPSTNKKPTVNNKNDNNFLQKKEIHLFQQLKLSKVKRKVIQKYL